MFESDISWGFSRIVASASDRLECVNEGFL